MENLKGNLAVILHSCNSAS